MFDFHEPEPPKVYWLDVRAGLSDVDRHEIYADFEMARHNYEVWKYDSRVMNAHGSVSLVEMTPDEMASMLLPENSATSNGNNPLTISIWKLLYWKLDSRRHVFIRTNVNANIT